MGDYDIDIRYDGFHAVSRPKSAHGTATRR
jgi:hypothetical protein